MVLAAFKAAVRALRGLRRWVRLPFVSANRSSTVAQGLHADPARLFLKDFASWVLRNMCSRLRVAGVSGEEVSDQRIARGGF